MGKPRKTFYVDQVVEVQRDVGKSWEPATYHEQMWRPGHDDPRSMKGWHRVLLHGAPRYINKQQGYECDKDHEHAVPTQFVLVPTQRIRARKS